MKKASPGVRLEACMDSRDGPAATGTVYSYLGGDSWWNRWPLA